MDIPEVAFMYGIILAIDPILDRFEMSVNVMGDCIAVGVIHGRHLDSWEEDLAANANAVRRESLTAKEAAVAASTGSRRPSRVEVVNAAFASARDITVAKQASARRVQTIA